MAKNKTIVKNNVTPNDGFTKDDFKFVQKDSKIFDQKFDTKPTTFFKDCVKRFCKNKSSVVAAIILGTLLLLSLVVPTVGKLTGGYAHQTDGTHTEIAYLEPKIFPSGTGFWDGTKKMKDISVDTSDPNPNNWGPDKEKYFPNAISNLEIGEENYSNLPTQYGKGGYVQFGYFDLGNNKDYIYLSQLNVTTSKNYVPATFDFTDTLTISNFDVFDEAKLASAGETTTSLPQGYAQGKCALYFVFGKNGADYEIKLTDYQETHDKNVTIDVQSKFNALKSEKSFADSVVNNPTIQIRLLNTKDNVQRCVLIKSIKINVGNTIASNALAKTNLESLSFDSGNEAMLRNNEDVGFWNNYEDTTRSRKAIYLARTRLCSFTYDTYEHALGKKEMYVTKGTLDDWLYNGWIKFSRASYSVITDGNGNKVVDPESFYFNVLNDDKCPLAGEVKASDVVLDQSTELILGINATVYTYKMDPYNLSDMPIFIFGTDFNGYDMFIYVFEGLRLSLLIGVATTIVCFLFGLLWGSISGYFGGTVDLVMERFTDILSGVPWIVVMTLVIIKLKQNFFTFALALCLTGWIGTAATTRTQFYRFRGREYVLASRTLGASHGRLIAKHILPNAMGTIITSAVLMVPSVIFSEATLSFLGLFNDASQHSLGVILAQNQGKLTTYPYLLIFPSVIIALVMISFNLFGNGLRDAVNPSLKGEE